MRPPLSSVLQPRHGVRMVDVANKKIGCNSYEVICNDVGARGGRRGDQSCGEHRRSAGHIRFERHAPSPSLVIRADERRRVKAVRQKYNRDPNGGFAVGPRRSGL